MTVIGLDSAYRGTLDRSRAELLEAQLLGLIALAETDIEGRITLPQETINPQFGLANSGLFGVVWDSDGFAVWQSQERERVAAVAAALGALFECPVEGSPGAARA